MIIKPIWLSTWSAMAIFNGSRILAAPESTEWLVEAAPSAVSVRRLQTTTPFMYEGINFTHVCVLKFSKGAPVMYALGDPPADNDNDQAALFA